MAAQAVLVAEEVGLNEATRQNIAQTIDNTKEEAGKVYESFTNENSTIGQVHAAVVDAVGPYTNSNSTMGQGLHQMQEDGANLVNRFRSEASKAGKTFAEYSTSFVVKSEETAASAGNQTTLIVTRGQEALLRFKNKANEDVFVPVYHQGENLVATVVNGAAQFRNRTTGENVKVTKQMLARMAESAQNQTVTLSQRVGGAAKQAGQGALDTIQSLVSWGSQNGTDAPVRDDSAPEQTYLEEVRQAERDFLNAQGAGREFMSANASNTTGTA